MEEPSKFSSSDLENIIANFNDFAEANGGADTKDDVWNYLVDLEAPAWAAGIDVSIADIALMVKKVNAAFAEEAMNEVLSEILADRQKRRDAAADTAAVVPE